MVVELLTHPPRPVERSSLQFRVLALRRLLPCIWRALPIAPQTWDRDVRLCEELLPVLTVRFLSSCVAILNGS